MRGLKQRSMPSVDDFVATCSVCGAALRPVHVLRGSAGPRCSFCGSALVSAGRDGNERTRPQPDDDSPLGLLTEFDRPRRVPRGVLIAVSIVVLLVIVAVAFVRQRSGIEATAPVDRGGSESVAPGNDDPSDVPPRRYTRVRAVVDVTSTSYVLATADGEVVREGTYSAGNELTLKADEELTLRLGNAGGVLIRAGGRDIRTGPDGRVVEVHLWLDDGKIRERRIRLA